MEPAWYFSKKLERDRVLELSGTPDFVEYKNDLDDCSVEEIETIAIVAKALDGYRVKREFGGDHGAVEEFQRALLCVADIGKRKHKVTDEDTFVSQCMAVSSLSEGVIHDIACGRKTAYEVASLMATDGNLKDVFIRNMNRKACRTLATVACLFSLVGLDYTTLCWAAGPLIDYTGDFQLKNGKLQQEMSASAEELKRDLEIIAKKSKEENREQSKTFRKSIIAKMSSDDKNAFMGGLMRSIHDGISDMTHLLSSDDEDVPRTKKTIENLEHLLSDDVTPSVRVSLAALRAERKKQLDTGAERGAGRGKKGKVCSGTKKKGVTGGVGRAGGTKKKGKGCTGTKKKGVTGGVGRAAGRGKKGKKTR